MNRTSLVGSVKAILGDAPREWQAVRRAARGPGRVAFRELKVDWEIYNNRDYLFTHDTIVASVATEDDGYTIKPGCFDLVNANGNAWTNAVLRNCYKTFIGGENYCFVKGTRVLMADGTYKPIEEVKVGDRVINAKGDEDTVVKTFQHLYTGKLVELQSESILSQKLICTANHPVFFCKRGTAPRIIPAEDLNPARDFLIRPQAGEPYGFVFRFTKAITSAAGIAVYNLEVENDHSYIAEGVAVHNCEHLQVPSMSKGKILDAILREVEHGGEKIWVCDILVATSRRHRMLCERIERGELKTLSMGATANFVQCSVCGRIFDTRKEEELCSHLSDSVGKAIDYHGKKKMCAELCGAIDPKTGDYIPDSCVFIEASWVEQPAFEGAVTNFLVETPKIAAERKGKAELESAFRAALLPALRVADRGSKFALAELRRAERTERIAFNALRGG